MSGFANRLRSATNNILRRPIWTPAFCKLRLIFATPIARRLGGSGAPSKKRARIANVARVFSTFDVGEDRFEQRARMTFRPCLTPKSDHVNGRAKLEQARPLSLCDIDRPDKAFLRGLGFALPQRKLP